jgi:hypothetical protein
MTKFTEQPENIRQMVTNHVRPVWQWLNIFHTQTDGTPTGISARIMADLWGYGARTKGDRYRNQDTLELANALEAYAAFTRGEVAVQPALGSNK